MGTFDPSQLTEATNVADLALLVIGNLDTSVAVAPPFMLNVEGCGERVSLSYSRQYLTVFHQ